MPYNPSIIYVADARQYNGKGARLPVVPLEEASSVFSRGYVPPLPYVAGSLNIVTGPFNGQTRTHIEDGHLELILDDEIISPTAIQINIIPFGSIETSTNAHTLK